MPRHAYDAGCTGSQYRSLYLRSYAGPTRAVLL